MIVVKCKVYLREDLSGLNIISMCRLFAVETIKMYIHFKKMNLVLFPVFYLEIIQLVVE